MDMGIELNTKSNKPERTKMSQSQFGLMVDFLSLNRELLCGRLSEKYSKEAVNKKWKDLASLLNSDGTGACKTAEKWKKAWQDQKNYLKNKIQRIKTAKSSTNPADRLNVCEISDLEERAWSMIQSEMALKNIKLSQSMNGDDTTVLSQDLEENGYILLNVEGIPLKISAEQVEGIVGVDAELIHNIDDDPEQLPATNNGIVNSVIVNDTRMKSYPEHSALDTSEIPSASEETGATHDASSNESNHDEQNSCSNNSLKRVKVQNCYSSKKRKKESGVIHLLQRQNELLEYIASSISRIEKFLDKNSSQHSQTKSAVGNIAENIDKIAGSLGSVSKSLKKLSEK